MPRTERNTHVRDVVKEANTMIKTRALYWTITGLMTSFMLMASIPDLLRAAQAVAIFRHLGYPSYLLRFLGTAKCLGVIAILAPGLPRLKEWAFAGLIFDLLGALYSHVSVGDPASVWLFPLLGLTLVTGAYLTYRRQAAGLSRSAYRVDVRTEPRLNYSVGRDVAARLRSRGHQRAEMSHVD
jgi:DoxX-like family